ncbi:hypothetical protein A5320_08130 [Rheinheimera sp. SA_1]|nr:hypothetical protein A5320_08130 [Rheinheimera sp. SA_1]
MIFSADFFSRIYLDVDAKDLQMTEASIPEVVVPTAIPAELKKLIANFKSSTKGENAQSQNFDSAVLAQYKFTLLAIFFKSGQYTAVMSAKDIKNNKDEIIKLMEGEQYSGISVSRVQGKLVEMQHHDRSIKLRLFDNSSPQERESL